MNFSFLEKYRITTELIEERGAKSTHRLRHLLFALPEYQIGEALKTFDPFPEELKNFYTQIGFGFMHRKRTGKVNMLLDPATLVYTNLQVNYFATPEVAEELKYYNAEKQLLFFQTVSNRYFAIDRQTVNGRNKVYYRGEAFEDSLYDFLKSFDFDDYLVNVVTSGIDERQKREREQELKAKNRPPENKNVKYFGQYILIDPD